MESDKYTILCVDDERNVLRSLKRLFFDSEYKIVTAESGEEGLKKLEERTIQVIISD
ncbi:MAG: response regulator [FCB group bacterium]|nr:response regulator [FCB group bacterium]